MIKAIPLFAADLEEGGKLFAVLMEALVKSCAQSNRMRYEID
jgi:hypothetical protein